MANKYIAYDYSYLGQTCDTREQAERAAKGMDYQCDSYTGYSTAFNCEPLSHADVVEIEDRQISIEEYLRSQEEYKEAKRQFDEEVKKLRQKMLGKYYTIKAAYVNTNTPYNYGDKIRLVTRRESCRKRTIDAHVCGVLIEKNGEIRPDLRGCSYPRNEEIISIEVLERFDYKTVNQRVVCKNCKHYQPINNPHGYGTGYCALHDKQIHFHVENQPCYENEPGKYDNVK